MKKYILLFLFSFTFFNVAPPSNSLKNNIVQVRITYQNPNFINPWKTKNPSTINAVGIVTEGNKILVLASLIEYSTLIEVKKFSSYQYAKANAVRIDLEGNMALLQTDDASFFNDLSPLEFYNNTPTQTQVKIAQLDNAGSIQVATARILTMDLDVFALGHTELPAFEITSNEKFFGSGELVLAGQQPTGILSFYQNGGNSGKMIPGFMINHFLKSVPQQGANSVFNSKGFFFKPITRKADREYFGLENNTGGIIVTQIIPGSSAWNVLKPADVITNIGGYKIDARGFFDHEIYGKQSLGFIVYNTNNAKLPLDIIRNKKKISLTMDLKPFPYQAIRIPFNNYEWKQPGYLISGGFIFLELSEFLLREWGKDWRTTVKKKLLYLSDFHRFHKTTDPGRIIIMSQVLPDAFNEGYHDFSLLIVRRVNDKKVSSLKELYNEISKASGTFISITLENGVEIVMERGKLKEADSRIMQKFNIPSLYNHE